MSTFLNPIGGTVGPPGPAGATGPSGAAGVGADFTRKDLSKFEWWGMVGPGNNTATPKFFGILDNSTVVDFSSAISTNISGLYFAQNTNTPSGNVLGIYSQLALQTKAGSFFKLDFALRESGNLRFFAGIMDTPTSMPSDSDEPPTGYVGLSFFTSRGDVNFTFMQATSAGANPLTTDSSVPVTLDRISFEMETDDGLSYNCRILDFDDNILGSGTLAGASNLPTTGANKSYGYREENLDVSSRQFQLYQMFLGVKNE